MAIQIDINYVLDFSSISEAREVLSNSKNNAVLYISNGNKRSLILSIQDLDQALSNGANINDTLLHCMAQKLIPYDSKNVPSITNSLQLIDIGKSLHIASKQNSAIPIAAPSLIGNEEKYLIDCINSNWISSQGKYIHEFQRSFSSYHDNTPSLCTSSGTTALHLALLALDIGQGDEVIIPNITFGASANVIYHAGAVPVLVDINPDTWTIDIKLIEEAITHKTKAIMPVHLYGHPCDMDPIMYLAEKYNLKVVEDCAEALGAEYKSKKVGLIGDIGCFSFFANKVISTGEGGMVLSKNSSLMSCMEILRDHGMSKEKRYWHLLPGFNYRLTNMQASIGLAQMENLDLFLNHRKKIISCYQRRLSCIDSISIPRTKAWATNIHWLFTIEVHSNGEQNRDSLAKFLRTKNIDTRTVFSPLHIQPAYCKKMNLAFPVSDKFSSEGLCLPTSNSIPMSDIEFICDCIAEYFMAK